MAIKVSNTTVIDDSRNLTNVANATLGTSGTDTATIVSQVSANGSVGTAGQVLTSRGANLSPQWTTVTGGGGGGAAVLGTPSVFPVLGNSILGPFISSAFTVTSGEDAHKSSDWQFSTSSSFTSFTYQALDTQGGKIQLFVPEGTFTPGTTYYVRVRHRSWSGSVSSYSSGTSFVAKATPNTNLDVVPIGENLYRTVVNSTNGTVLAFSAVSGNIYRSVDNGVNFTRVFTGASNPFFNAVYSPGLNMFLAFNYANSTSSIITAYYSTDDGLTWLSYTMPTTLLRTAGDLVWNPNNSKFYAVGCYASTVSLGTASTSSTTNGSVISSVDGLNWVQHAPSTLNAMYKIAFSSDNRFIAAGAQSEYIQSADGVTWTVQSTIAGLSNLDCLGLAYSPTLNLWSYIPGNNNSNVYTSTDRVNWTATALAENINVASSAPYLNANYTQYYWDTNLARFMLNMVYSTNDNTRYIGESTNGTSFTRSALTSRSGTLNVYSGNTYLIATNGEKFLRTGVATYTSQGSDFVTSTITRTISCDSDNNRFVASCSTGLVYSTDSTGRKWKQVTGISDTAIYKVVFVNNLWRAYSLGTTYGSTDGINWTQISSSPAYYVWQIIYDATLNKYIGIGGSSIPTSATDVAAVVFTSPDAASFTVVKSFSSGEDFDYYPSPIEYNQSEQAYVIFFGGTTYKSTDGTTWTETTPNTSTYINDSLYSSTYDKCYLAASGYIYSSKAADATNRFKFRIALTASALTFNHLVQGTGANAGVILAGTTNGNIYRSSDGITFTSVNSGLNTPINALKYVNNLFIALSNSGLISYSSDGITWTVFQILSNTAYQIFDVAYANNGNYIFITRGVTATPSHYTNSLTVQATASTYSNAPTTTDHSYAIGYSTAQNIAVFLGGDGYIFYSTNGGASYTRVNPTGRTSVVTYDIQYFPHISKWLTCSSNGSVVSTSTDGINWVTVTNAFNNSAIVVGMQYVSHENRIYFKSGDTAGTIRFTPDGSTFTLETLDKAYRTLHILAADSKTYVMNGQFYVSASVVTGGVGFNYNKKSGSGAWAGYSAIREIRRSVVLNNKNYRFTGNTPDNACFEDTEDFYLVKDYVSLPAAYNQGMRTTGSYLFCCSNVGDVAYTTDGLSFTSLSYQGKAVQTHNTFDIAINDDAIFVTNFSSGFYGFFVSQSGL